MDIKSAKIIIVVLVAIVAVLVGFLLMAKTTISLF